MFYKAGEQFQVCSVFFIHPVEQIINTQIITVSENQSQNMFILGSTLPSGNTVCICNLYWHINM